MYSALSPLRRLKFHRCSIQIVYLGVVVISIEGGMIASECYSNKLINLKKAFMSIATEKTAVDKAQDYYNSTPADEFYFKIWGGEHIHVGIYNHPKEAIKEASPPNRPQNG